MQQEMLALFVVVFFVSLVHGSREVVEMLAGPGQPVKVLHISWAQLTYSREHTTMGRQAIRSVGSKGVHKMTIGLSS